MRLEIVAPDALAPEVARRIDARASSPFQTVAYARILGAIRDDARVVVVLDGADEVGHAIVRANAPLGFARWDGVGAPATGADPARFWSALVAAAKEARIVSLAWREPTITRFDAHDIMAAKAGCDLAGARLAVGRLWGTKVRLDDDTWARFDRRHRNAARHAQRDGVGIERGGEGFADDFARLAEATWARSGRSGLPAAYFADLVAQAWIGGWLARTASGEPTAGAIVAREGEGALYLHGASVPVATGASQLLQWRIMEALRAEGVRTYDLGSGQPPGSPQDDVHEQGIRRFKERFGGEPQERPTIQIAPDPALYEKAREAALRNPPGHR